MKCENELLNRFLNYEDENKLFDYCYDGIYFWEIIRSFIYIEINAKKNNLNPLIVENEKKKRKKYNLKILNNCLKLFFINNKNIFFIGNPRRTKINNESYYCPYTDPICELIKNKYSYVTFEEPYWYFSKTSNISHYLPVANEPIIYNDFLDYYFKFKKYFFGEKNKHIKDYIDEIQRLLETEFQCDLTNAMKRSYNDILYFFILKNKYYKLLKRCKPKVIIQFFDPMPTKAIMNYNAKKLNIPIIEIQHGIVTTDEPIFLKFKNKNNARYLPDYLFSFGKKFLNKNNLAYNDNKIFYIGSPILQKRCKDKKEDKLTDKKIILFLSQSNLGDKISQFANDTAKLLKNNKEFQIIYKCHPYELEKNYEHLKDKNITIINNYDKDIYYYLSNAYIQVGIYSTSIYEGLAFNLPTFIIYNNFGFKGIKNILRNEKGIYYIDNPQQLINILKEKPEIPDSSNWWAINDNDHILKIIDKIIFKP